MHVGLCEHCYLEHECGTQTPAHSNLELYTSTTRIQPHKNTTHCVFHSFITLRNFVCLTTYTVDRLCKLKAQFIYIVLQISAPLLLLFPSSSFFILTLTVYTHTHTRLLQALYPSPQLYPIKAPFLSHVLPPIPATKPSSLSLPFLLLLTVVLLLSSLLPLSSAIPDFRNRIPNGYAADTPGTGLTCVRVGHTECNPATATSIENNPFGLAFKAADLKWTKEQCEADSDGDGQTNGAELGDPCCKWDPDLRNDDVLRKTELSNPGDASETNSAEDCPATPTDTAAGPSPVAAESVMPSTVAAESATPSSSAPAMTTPEAMSSASTSPKEASPSNSGDSDDVCFPGSASVRLVDGTSKKMADIVIGDVVQVAYPIITTTTNTSGKYNMMPYSYSPVLGFSHRVHNVIYNHFVAITASDGSSITLTPGHFTYAPTLKPARVVRVGDVLPGLDGDRMIVDVVYDVKDKGLFNPHTETGTIVVNGLVQSCYTESVDVHKAHALLAPVRAMWKAVPQRWRQSIALDIADKERNRGEKQWWDTMGLRALLPLVRSTKV